MSDLIQRCVASRQGCWQLVARFQFNSSLVGGESATFGQAVYIIVEQ